MLVKIPQEIIDAVERETDGINHGIVTLAIHIREGQPRFVLNKEVSIKTDTDSKCDRGLVITRNNVNTHSGMNKGMKK